MSELQKTAIELITSELENDTTDTLNMSRVRDITTLASNYTTDIFVQYERTVTDGDEAADKKFLIRITFEGLVDYEPFTTLKFDTLKDRVHFFANLYPLKTNAIKKDVLRKLSPKKNGARKKRN